MKSKEIKVRVEFSEGYEKRFTEACLQQLRKRNKANQMPQISEEKIKTA